MSFLLGVEPGMIVLGTHSCVTPQCLCPSSSCARYYNLLENLCLEISDDKFGRREDEKFKIFEWGDSFKILPFFSFL